MVAIAVNFKYTVVACEGGVFHVFATDSGRRILSPIVLGEPIVLLRQGSESLADRLVVVTAQGKIHYLYV
jgi:hypothetical protein